MPRESLRALPLNRDKLLHAGFGCGVARFAPQDLEMLQLVAAKAHGLRRWVLGEEGDECVVCR